MALNFYQVDAFTDQPFAGNPAMVYRLSHWLPDAQMQAIAAEHNLAETVFVGPDSSGDSPSGLRIRWFTPAIEVDLCGHATLAAAKILSDVYGLELPLHFASLSGELRVQRDGQGRLQLDFPVQPCAPLAVSAEMRQALGVPVLEAVAGLNLLLRVESEAALRACTPDLRAIKQWPYQGVIVTAEGKACDFVSRYFAPQAGIDEDPVTGSAHCALMPFWVERLGKTTLTAQQLSRRGGDLCCELVNGRVLIAGEAQIVAKGELLVTLA
ncbi:PhzF family phenazine biosynthesis protein [Atopomonas sediminilitoris]|uniref:PhzF family phenazine biosynthesis protein n=1 Tax=Atopomonas sediminilitoris TaxID=2919919 RepID=UPI001F4D594D|nr:PhzF family phenazine biosynthesis protein [Atopomonas sediminilitoris]